MANKKTKVDKAGVSGMLGTAGVSPEMIDAITAKMIDQQKLTGKQYRVLLDSQKKMAKSYAEMSKEIDRLINKGQKIEEADLKKLKILQKQQKNYKELITAGSDYTEVLQGMGQALEGIGVAALVAETALFGVGLAMAAVTAAMRLVTAAADLAVAAFERWWELENQMVATMGRFEQATGATSMEMDRFREVTLGLNETFMNLNGSAWAVSEAGAFLTEALIPLRRSVTELGAGAEDLSLQLLVANRTLGMSATEAAHLFFTIRSGVGTSADSIVEFRAEMVDLAASVGGNVTTMARDFNENTATLALFGDQATETFGDAEMMANYFGIEVGRVLAMTQRFNSFSNAAQSVNQLNAVFGTTLSSMELMLEQNPAERMNMMLEAVRESGTEIDPYNAQALADALGVSADEAIRMVEGASFDEIRAEAEARADSDAARLAHREAAEDRIWEILERSRVAMTGFWTIVERVYNIVVTALSPIFEEIQSNIESAGGGLTDWVQALVSGEGFTNMVHDIRDWIREISSHASAMLPSWEEIEGYGRQLWHWISGLMEQFGGVLENSDEFQKQLQEMEVRATALFEDIAHIADTIATMITEMTEEHDQPTTLDNMITAANTLADILHGIMEAYDYLRDATGVTAISALMAMPDAPPGSLPPAEVESSRPASIMERIGNFFSSDDEMRERAMVDSDPTIASRRFILEGATESAPVTEPTSAITAPVSALTATPAIAVTTTSAQVVLDGRRVGDAFLQTTARVT